MSGFSEIHETLKGPRKRHAAMVLELVSNARSRGHKIMSAKA